MTDLLYSDVEESVRDSVRSVLSRRFSHDTAAALYDAPDTDVSGLWQALSAELGLAALLVPEEAGGAGATAREAAVVCEELGRAVAAAPFLTSAVIATTALSRARSGGADVDAHLQALAGGEQTAVLVLPWTARHTDWRPVAAGTPVRPVAGALQADLFLVPAAGEAGTELRLLTADQVGVEALTALDMTRPLAAVTVGAAGAGTLVASGSDADRAVTGALRAGAALLASEQYGVARWCLEATVAYAKTRVQFARPIGSFQAVKHRLADLFLAVSQAQAAARYAADCLATEDPDQDVATAVAQAYCSDVAVRAAEEGVQLHGGIGMTWEHPVHLYLKRAKSAQLALGTPARHRADLATLVDLPAPA